MMVQSSCTQRPTFFDCVGVLPFKNEYWMTDRYFSISTKTRQATQTIVKQALRVHNCRNVGICQKVHKHIP